MSQLFLCPQAQEPSFGWESETDNLIFNNNTQTHDSSFTKFKTEGFVNHLKCEVLHKDHALPCYESFNGTVLTRWLKCSQKNQGTNGKEMKEEKEAVHVFLLKQVDGSIEL